MDKTSITLSYYPRSVLGKALQFVKVLPQKKTVFVGESRLDTRGEYAKALSKIPAVDLSKPLIEVDKELGNHVKDIIYAFAIVINNKGAEKPPQWILDSLSKESLTDLISFWHIILSLLNSELFVTSVMMFLGIKVNIE